MRADDSVNTIPATPPSLDEVLRQVEAELEVLRAHDHIKTTQLISLFDESYELRDNLNDLGQVNAATEHATIRVRG